MNAADAQKTTLSESISKILESDLDEALKAVDLNKLLPALDAEVQRLANVETPWSPDYKDLVYCNNADDVKTVVQQAIAGKKILRTAGAQHSTPDAVFAKSGEPRLKVKLENDLRSITVLETNADYLRVRVGAGCNLGIDPSDPNSNAENSFTRTVDKLGFAVPILGGMSHQTIGGFMMTSTAGGSLFHGFADVVEAIEFIDGTGQEQVFTSQDDEFFAAAVSMGLYGILTYVTLKLPKNYLVNGVEETVSFQNSIISTAAGFENALKTQEYVHCVWFAQTGVQSVLQFRGVQAADNAPITPYQHPLAKKYMNYLAAAVFFAINELQYNGSEASIKLAAFLLNLINPISSRHFCDHWYIALPNDDQALVDTVIRVQFTEIWVDVEHTDAVIAALNSLFEKDPLAAGNFGVELYGAKASPFWMSQSYNRDVVRVDPYWWEFNPTGDLQDFFTQYWDVLLAIPTARLHWGKHFPAFGTRFGNFTVGPDYVAQAYPKFEEWLNLRERFDPGQIFVTDYWRSMFGIAPAAV